MKKVKFKLLSLLFVATSVLISCNKNDDEVQPVQGPQTITSIAKGNTDLSILVSALVKADLAATLDMKGDYTVFAPTNTAFNAFLKAKGFASLDVVPVAALKQILLNHVLVKSVKSSDLKTGYVKTMAMGGASTTNTLSMFINTADKKVVINGGMTNMGATVTAADVMASNGVIHVVDGVIDLPTIVTQAAANPNLATLVAALKFNPASNFVATLSGTENSPFTVFAPTNQAFTELLTDLKVNSLGGIDPTVLENALKYHVVTGANVESKTLTQNQVVKTFQGQNFTVNLTGGASIKDANDRVSKIIATDVQCSNGIVHVIDKVLLPSGK